MFSLPKFAETQQLFIDTPAPPLYKIYITFSPETPHMRSIPLLLALALIAGYCIPSEAHEKSGPNGPLCIYMDSNASGLVSHISLRETAGVSHDLLHRVNAHSAYRRIGKQVKF